MMCYGAICNTSLPLSHWFTLSSGKSNRNQWPPTTTTQYVREKKTSSSILVPVFSQMIDQMAG